MSKKIKTMRLSNFEDVDNALLEIGRTESVVAKKEAEMNSKIQQLKEKYDTETETERRFIDETKERIENFCMANKTDFDKQRTFNLKHGSVGFRNNPPKVVQLNKKWTVKSSLEFVKKLFNGTYVRAKEELNKDQILADYAGKVLDDSKLAAVGLRIDNDETFTTEINWESLQA